MVRSLTISGFGLIGGSLGLALRACGWRVAFIDPNVSLEAALAAGAADEKLDAPRGDELTVLAMPVDGAVGYLRLLHGGLTTGGLITSTCSVMLPLRAAGHDSRFVAGHPFAGSEKSGFEAARPDLFRGRPWFVERDEPAIRAMIEAAGARQVIVDPARHDELVALTSHLPQVLSTALASLIEQRNVDPEFLGSGLRTFLRLAGSSFDVWDPVLEANREHVGRALDELLRIAGQLEEKDFDRARKLMGTIKPDGNQ